MSRTFRHLDHKILWNSPSLRIPDSSVVEHKKFVRGFVKRKLRAFADIERIRESSVLTTLIMESPSWKTSQNVCFYHGIQGLEMETDPLINIMREVGKRVFFPLVVNNLDMVMVEDLDRKYSLTRFKETEAFDIIGDSDVIDPRGEVERMIWPDLVIMPGLAFSMRDGKRLGYGGGFYDRWISDMSMIRRTFFGGDDLGFETMALCLTPQVLPEVPTESHDVSVNSLISLIN